MTISANNNQKINKLLFGTPYRAGMHTVVRCESRLFTFYWFGFIGKFVSNSRERISIFSGQNPAVQEVWYSSLFPFYIRPVIIIPLISERHGRPLTKLLSQESNKILSPNSNVLHLKSRTFCVAFIAHCILYFWIYACNIQIVRVKLLRLIDNLEINLKTSELSIQINL